MVENLIDFISACSAARGRRPGVRRRTRASDAGCTRSPVSAPHVLDSPRPRCRGWCSAAAIGVGLRRAVASQYGFAPTHRRSVRSGRRRPPMRRRRRSRRLRPSPRRPGPIWPATAPPNLASPLHRPGQIFFSPPQDISANVRQGAFNRLACHPGWQDHQTATVTRRGHRRRQQQHRRGDGAVLGNGNAVTNGDIRADHGSNISRRSVVIHDGPPPPAPTPSRPPTPAR